MERWRRVIGHDGYLVATLRITTPAEGGRSRAVQSGYHAGWWRVDASDESWLGSGPIDLMDEQRSIKPGHSGRVAIRPMDPQVWRGVQAGTVLHLRERVGQTLGVATVEGRVRMPDHAPLRPDPAPLRGAVPLRAEGARRLMTPWGERAWAMLLVRLRGIRTDRHRDGRD